MKWITDFSDMIQIGPIINVVEHDGLVMLQFESLTKERVIAVFRFVRKLDCDEDLCEFYFGDGIGDYNLLKLGLT